MKKKLVTITGALLCTWLLVSTSVGQAVRMYDTLAKQRDVTITSPVSGNFLRWNGTKWVNVAISSGDIPDLSATYQPKDTDLTTWAGITPGTGVGTALAINVGSAGAFLLNNGSAANLTNFPTLNQNTTGSAATVITNANLTGHVTSTGNAAILGSFTLAQLNAAVSDADVPGLATANTFTAVNTFGSGLLKTTSPWITIDLKDSNGNSMLAFTATGSAVNNFTIANAASGNGPTLGTSGNNANFNITPNGSGSVIISTTANSAIGAGGEIDTNGFEIFATVAAAKARTIASRTAHFGANVGGGIFGIAAASDFHILWTNNASSSGSDGGNGGSALGGLYSPSSGVFAFTNGTDGQWASLKLGTRDSGTNTIIDAITTGHQSTGTPAAGFGEAWMGNLNSSTTADQNAFRLYYKWSDATHATRTSAFGIQLVNSAAALADVLTGSPTGITIPGTLSVTGDTSHGGNITTTAVGKTVAIKSGANSKAGTFTCVAGVAVVGNTSVTANSVIVVTLKTNGGARNGNPDCVPASGTGFIATGAVTDTSTYNYVIVEVN